jgi:NAD dependent epimerase/dehydratase family enzyme
MASILISGGNGFVGKELCKLLQQKGYEVSVLSRKLDAASPFKIYLWNPNKNEIDSEAIQNTDYIIHLAGENISGKRWTTTQKQKIINSRIKSANVIFDKTKELNKPIKAFVFLLCRWLLWRHYFRTYFY